MLQTQHLCGIISLNSLIISYINEIIRNKLLNTLTLADYGKDLSSTMKNVDVFPIVKHYIEQLDIHNILNHVIPCAPQSEVAPAQTLCVMIANIVIAKHPLYKIEKWIAKYVDGKAEKNAEESTLYNDDKCSRALDKLYVADRNTLLTQISAKAIEVYQLELKQINNDSTSISFAGNYNDNIDTQYDTVNLTYGFSKDHRPDCKQVVFGLSTTSDGHVPIKYELFDGNRTDDTTHTDTWDSLRTFMKTTDFVYIADSKLCTMNNLTHIAKNGGKFITVMPRNRKEVTTFYQQLFDGLQIKWQEEYSIPSTRKKGEFTKYKLYEGSPTIDGYRVIWVHSNNKAKQDGDTRNRRIQKALEQLQELQPRLNKHKLKTREQIQAECNTINKYGFILINIDEHKTVYKKQLTRGKPTADTQYQEIEEVTYTINWCNNDIVILQDSYTDGIFPLISNTAETMTQILQRYKTQPFLEKRFQTSKSVLEIAPVFLKKPERIEAMMFLYFIALMIVSLLERNIRKQLKQTPTELRILPNRRNATSPTWSNIKEFFSDIYLSILKYKQESLAKLCGLSDLHKTVLTLLKVPILVYSNLQNNWWEFNLTG
jgi:transposase